jgi:hypothetical protein
MIVKKIGDEFSETYLEKDKVYISEPNVPHLTIALEDSVAYEWWDGSSSMTPIKGVFDEYFKKFRKP